VFPYPEKSRFDYTITYFGTAEGPLAILPDFEGQLGIQSPLYKNNLDFQHKKSLIVSGYL
jgi:hypothetical protein